MCMWLGPNHDIDVNLCAAYKTPLRSQDAGGGDWMKMSGWQSECDEMDLGTGYDAGGGWMEEVHMILHWR